MWADRRLFGPLVCHVAQVVRVKPRRRDEIQVQEAQDQSRPTTSTRRSNDRRLSTTGNVTSTTRRKLSGGDNELSRNVSGHCSACLDPTLEPL